MIGTREWIAVTGGKLRRRERVAHQAGAIAALASDLSSRQRFRWAADAQGLGPVDVPGTDLVRATTTWAEGVHEPWLFGHALRTWVFGRMLGQVEGLEVDDEPLYLACLLHDIGLTAEYRVPIGGPGDACHCFAAHGAHVSEAALLDLGASPLLASEVADAIGMHVNSRVEPAAGPTALLVHQGAALDVVGARAAVLGRGVIRGVLDDHDRAGFTEELLRVLRSENHERPRSRMASFFGVGMGQAVALNPLNRL